MSYTKTTDFAAKDALLTGNPSKVVKGSEIDAEFDAIETADAQNVKLTGAQTLTDKTLTSPVITNPTVTGGVAFPATQTPSADANTLDDYEEGSFTPQLYFGSISGNDVTHSIQTGRYTKIGRYVMCKGYIAISNKGVRTGSASIGDLPIVGASVMNVSVANIVISNLAGAIGHPYGSIVGPTQSIALLEQLGTSVASLTDADFTNTTTIAFEANYEV